VLGSGKWQSLVPRSFLELAFSPPCVMDVEIARKFEVGHSTPACVRAAAAHLLIDAQREEVQKILRLDDLDFVIFQIMWDVGTFRVMCNGYKAKKESIFGMHGHLTWSTSGKVYNQVITLPPSALWGEAAEDMKGAIAKNSPLPLLLRSQAPSSPDASSQALFGLNLGCDGANSNRRLLQDIDIKESESPNNFVLKGFCRNHGVGLCIEPVSLYLNVLSPAFCLIQRLHHGSFHNRFIRTLFDVIDARLIFCHEVDDPWFKPDPAHRQYAERVLELTFYSRDLHKAFADPEEKADLLAQDQRRRAVGKQLLDLMPGDWRSKHIIFHAAGTPHLEVLRKPSSP
jgi:hypothetical protein